MRRAAALTALAAALLLASCSTAPERPEQASDVKNRAAAAAKSGNEYYREGRYDLALQFHAQALKENQSVDNEPGVVGSYNSIGRIYLAVGMIDEAETQFLLAWESAERLGGESLFVTSINLGELQLRRADAAGALETFERVAGGPLAGMPPDQVGLLYHNLGSAYKATGDLERALEWLQKALAVNVGAKLYEEAASDCYMIASVYSKQGDYAAAARNAELALEYDKRVENPLGVVKDLLALGRIAEKVEDHASAWDYFRRAHLAATAQGSRADTRAALEGLISSGEALGKTAEVAGHRKALAALGSP
jgi:tetratricopeptide (TPR) repeat protein